MYEKNMKRSEGLLDRYFGFFRKIGINKKRGKETEKQTFKMECSFYKKKDFRWNRARTSIINKDWFSVQSLISCCYGISDLWGVYIYFFIVNGYKKFNFCNVLFLPYIYVLKNLILNKKILYLKLFVILDLYDYCICTTLLCILSFRFYCRTYLGIYYSNITRNCFSQCNFGKFSYILVHILQS